MLDGLELGSPYQWHLAHRDLLSGLEPYSAERIQVTILVGIKDYDGLRGWVNKPGTDGTVVIAGTSLNTLKLTLDCTKGKQEAGTYTPYQWSTVDPIDEYAWAVLPGLDHGSIVVSAGVNDSPAAKLVLEALNCKTPTAFKALCKSATETTGQTYLASGKPRFQQFAVRAVDDQGNPIPDFTLEFFILKASKAEGGVTRDSKPSRAEQDFSEEAQKILLGEVHTHSQDPSHRRLLVDAAKLQNLLAKAATEMGGPVTLSMRIYVPRIDRGISYAVDQLQNVVLHHTGLKTKAPAFLFENTTTLLEIQVNRMNTFVTVGKTPRKH